MLRPKPLVSMARSAVNHFFCITQDMGSHRISSVQIAFKLACRAGPKALNGSPEVLVPYAVLPF
jgi:hypothetical protein